jgi:hypothetical protein
MAGRGQGSRMAWCSRAKHGYRYSRLRTAAAELTQSNRPDDRWWPGQRRSTPTSSGPLLTRSPLATDPEADIGTG